MVVNAGIGKRVSRGGYGQRSRGIGPVATLFVACRKSPGGSPCGACRQAISDLAPDARVVLWNGAAPPVVTSAAALLPGAFRGDGLVRVVA